MSLFSDFSEVFGWRLAAARKAAGMTQADVAAVMCVDQSTVSKWETGAALPSLYVAVGLASLLGVRLSDLVVGG